MADRLIICHHCCAILTQDECEHYIYECHTCVMAEHDLVLAWHRGDDHPEFDRLFTGPVVVAEITHAPQARVRSSDRCATAA